MKLLALDPGTKATGWAVFTARAPCAWGVVSTNGAAFEDRLPVIRRALDALVVDHQVTDVCWERVPPGGRGRYDTNAALLRALDLALRRWVVAWRASWACYLPNQVRAGISSSLLPGTLNIKHEVKAAILLRWPRAGIASTEPDHVFDAIAVGDYHLGQLRLLAMIPDPNERMRLLDRMQGKRAR